MKTCEECMLPILVCNTLAMYRKAIQYYELGRCDEAKNYAAYAQEDYDRYLAERPQTT
jgi:hypothetical protein